VAARAARWIVGLTLLAGALLQAIPRGGFWIQPGLSALFDDAARGGVPGPLSTPIEQLSSHIGGVAFAANGVLVAALVVVGVGLLLDVAPRVMSGVAVGLCLLTWWFGQGFGVFGGLGTDPNTGLVLVLFLAAGWPRPAAVDVVPVAAGSSWQRPIRVVGAAAAVGCLLLLPVVAVSGLVRPVGAEAAVGDSGGLQRLTPVAAPPIALTDQHGRPLSLPQFRGDVVLVAFLDPVCFEDCPLLANQLATAVGLLGAAGSDVQILAVDVNPTFHSVQDVRTFTNEHGLAGLPNWHFATGTNAAVGDVLASYGQGVSVPRVGMIGHPEAIYVIDRQGDAVGVLNDTANANLTRSYAQLMAEQVRHYL
jgi:cytochrome oxidase Cu insertion factor (SCO1/SenC/PrrC family)